MIASKILKHVKANPIRRGPLCTICSVVSAQDRKDMADARAQGVTFTHITGALTTPKLADGYGYDPEIVTLDRVKHHLRHRPAVAS